jgi:hypothetical protein
MRPPTKAEFVVAVFTPNPLVCEASTGNTFYGHALFDAVWFSAPAVGAGIVADEARGVGSALQMPIGLDFFQVRGVDADAAFEHLRNERQLFGEDHQRAVQDPIGDVNELRHGMPFFDTLT